MNRYCRYCKMLILPDIRYQPVQFSGFCNNVCEKLYQSEKQYVMDLELEHEHRMQSKEGQ